MFKANGTKIKNPERYVASVAKNGYTDPLFDAKGEEIRNPAAYLKKMNDKGAGPRVPVATNSRKRSIGEVDKSPGPHIMFKEDGTPIKNPERYLEILQNKGISEPLFTAEGTEIRNPVGFVNSQRGRAEEPDRKRSRVGGGGGAPLALPPSESMYKADGSVIRNPEAVIAGIERKGYTDPLFTAEGMEIKNPSAYLANALRRLESGLGSPRPATVPIGAAPRRNDTSARPAGRLTYPIGAPPKRNDNSARQAGRAVAETAVFNEVGDKIVIRNPEKYIASLEKNGHTKPLFTSRGEEIRDPVSYLSKDLRSKGTPMPEAQDADMAIYNEAGDKIVIRNPEKYIASIEKNGQTMPLFTASGNEIRDPVNYLKKNLKSAGASRPSAGTSRPSAGASRPSAGTSRPEASSNICLFNESGESIVIRNLEKYIVSMEKNGVKEPLFMMNGEEIRDPVQYLKNKLKNAGGGQSGPAPGIAMYDEAGERVVIRNPQKFIASLEKNGPYRAFFTRAGVEITDPVNYLKKNLRTSKNNAGTKGRSATTKKNVATKRPNGAGEKQQGLFKPDGTRINNPSAYIAKNPSEDLFNGNGQLINDPQAYVAAMIRNKSKATVPLVPRRANGKTTYYGKLGSFGKNMRSAIGARARAARR